MKMISYDYDDPSQKYQEGIKVSDRLPSLISSLRTSPLWAEQPAASRRGMRNTLRRKFMLLFCQGTIGTTKVDVFLLKVQMAFEPPLPLPHLEFVSIYVDLQKNVYDRK